MTDLVISQDVFSKGELSNYMYSRVTSEAYQKGLQTATNTLTYPSGAIGKRFGTIYQNEITGITAYTDIIFETFQYLNQCIYILVITAGHIYIYLEGILIADVTSNVSYTLADIQKLDNTVLNAIFRVSSPLYIPKDLTRGASSPQTITGFSSTTFTTATTYTVGQILPVFFSSTLTLPTTTPQVQAGVIYFMKAITIHTFSVYSTAPDAKAGIDAYTIANAGTGTVTVIPQNAWTFTNVAFSNYPVYDFDGGYDAITFTPAAVTGYGITVTLSAILASPASLTSKYIGGAFIGNGGIGRIVSVADTTHFAINIVQNFDSNTAIPGSICLLTEPAWSAARGYPAKCSSFQNRAEFANSTSLPNGLWLSVVNDYNDFNDIQEDDDNAISWYGTSDNVNYIRFIVPYRSLTIHTNSGIYSTPLTFETAITPNNFSMTLQDSTPATAVQPRAIDNQIIILSGNDVHSMLWDGFNNSYTSTIVSIASEHLIIDPHDEAEFVDLARAGSRYVFIINDNGSMAMFQTLISENVQGFTPATLYQSYGNAYFRWVTTSTEGRAWFVNERQIASASAPVAITTFTSTTLTAVATNFSTTTPTAVTFTTSGTLPETDPQIELATYYWAIGGTADTFTIYITQHDAANGDNPIEILSAGTSSNVVAWPLATKFYMEELSFDVYEDCATVYSGAPTSSITTGTDTPNIARFNAQDVYINGDGYGFEDEVVGSTIAISAHGSAVQVSEAQAGFPIDVIIEPLQIAPPGQIGYKGSSLTFAQHVKIASFMFIDTVGGTVNGQPITLTNFADITPNVPPEPLTGVMNVSLMKGWNEILVPFITIEHSAPFDIKLIGIFYKMDI